MLPVNVGELYLCRRFKTHSQISVCTARCWRCRSLTRLRMISVRQWRLPAWRAQQRVGLEQKITAAVQR